MNRTAVPFSAEAAKAFEAQKAVMETVIGGLECRIVELEEEVTIARQDAAEANHRAAALEEKLRLVLAKKFGPSSEKRKDRVFNEAEQVAADDESDEANEQASPEESAEGSDPASVVPDTGRPEREKHKKLGQKRGRKPLSAAHPRERVEHDLSDEEKLCPCCREQMHRMGETRTEQLHIEVKVVVRENVRFKYACRNCDRNGTSTPVVIAPMPSQPMPGSVATADTLAWVLAGKFVDGMPLYRMSTALKRMNVDLSRGTLGHWIVQSSERHLQRIYDVLHDRMRGQAMLHGDETRLQVLKEDGRDAQAHSYMWVYRSIDESAEPIVLFDYQPGRGMVHPKAFLGDFSGTLMSDGYEAWRSAFPNATHLGCMAHARRKFTDAVKANKKPYGLVAEALEFFGALYDVEHIARENSPGPLSRDAFIFQMRQQHSVPVLLAFKKWLDEKQPLVLPSSRLGEAISYALNQWDHLILYADDPRAPIDNNIIEREIKNFVIGRKNWLFCDTVEGAQASAVIYSLALTCRACGVNPQTWFAYVLTELPRRQPDADLDDLLPWNFFPDDKLAAHNSS